MLRKTLLPLSLKEQHHKLLELAGFLVRFGTASVSLCHIINGGGRNRRHKVEQALNEIAEKFKTHGFSTEVIIREGPVAGEICNLVEEVGADFISIPWKKKNVIKRTILSSPDIDILRICSYPTFIFKSRSYLQNDSKLDSIVYATDCKETDQKVLPYLTSVPFGAETLYFLHVRERAPDPVTDKQRHREVLAKLDQLAAQCRSRYNRVETVLSIGPNRTGIVRSVRKFDTDLIIIGRNDKQKPMDKILGSTAELLPHKVHSSVLIVA